MPKIYIKRRWRGVRCICGHTKSSHSVLPKQKDRMVVRVDYGKCMLHECDCKMYRVKK